MKFTELKTKSYEGYNLIEGFPSQDLIATITTKYLVDTLKMEKIGHIESDAFFPVVRINKGLPEHPIRIYADHKNKLLAILADQLIPNNLVHEYCKTLLDWANKKKIKGIYTVASVQVQNPSANVFGVTNNETGLKVLKENKIEIVKEGLTSGLGAQLILSEKKTPVYLILGTMTKTSYDVSANILATFNKLFKTNVDIKPLIKQSEIVVAKIKQQIADVESSKEEKKQIMYS